MEQTLELCSALFIVVLGLRDPVAWLVDGFGVAKNHFLSDRRNKVCFRQHSLICRSAFYRETRDSATADDCLCTRYQFSCTRLGLILVPFEVALVLAAANTFAIVLVRVTDCSFSSFLGFVVETFVLSRASALSFNHLLNFKRVGRFQSFLTVCIQQKLLSC